ncbi:hypothetical protein FNO01nite_19280 [Flavobacterium noncentrifugens]|uniref:MerR HTH family regulatory protein n=1 Tax=Flavobacterium noncentrifugens TaxID=1128970 RepID=A0A1G8YL04_9FLAO|nr:chaperone modulator CbpM [Flavobacterium noncentrifugens]GEP51256.1 hypothetical protein FNO01nite_19280 [Flavobacterium noncentrifugens]SDK03134.1 MerR HTH family regulatory protein [Flavobacterium noncentrifugens]
METQDHIAITIFSRHHGVETSFVTSLGDFGLIEIIEIEREYYFPLKQLPMAEKMIRLYLDLHVNAEGIDVVMNLLSRMDDMQHEITVLRNRLGLYE